MKRLVAVLLGVAVLATGYAGEFPGDQRLIDQAPARGAVPAATERAQPSESPESDLSQTERQARIDANTALAKLQIVLARKALRAGDLKEAALKAHHVLVLVRQVPPEVDLSELELQAEGILSRASRAGINVDTLAGEAADDAPLLEDDAELDRCVQGAVRVARQYEGPPRKDVDTSGDARALRERTLRRQMPDRHAYRPGGVIIDVEAVLATDRERRHYQGALRDAYKADEVRMLVSADEARVVSDGVVSYPNDWPERIRRREKWADGVVARSPSWVDKDGREWYVAVYDIHDLIYVPPDFGMRRSFLGHDIAVRDALDREALRDHSMIFRGNADDLFEGIPLLHYFGGMDPVALRGPKYSMERQQDIIDMIQAFTGGRVDDGTVLPIPPR